MMKKVLALLLVTAVVTTLCNIAVFAEDVRFPDLGEDHWAYQYVSVLVNDGTVKGNENGYFEPDKMVLRAEFVKMIGKGATRREIDFADVPKTHWGYDYIMTSGLNSDEKNNFNPSEPMTRGKTIELLWARAGAPTGIIAPSIITQQASNKDAVAWIYMNGVMVGSDGVNLRLGDPISRAETAALIVRARKIMPDFEQISFVNVASPKMLEAVYKSVNLFDMPYDPDKTITNAELARAAVRLASEEFNLTYTKFPVAAPFENAYAKDLAIIGKCIGQDKVNAGFLEQAATNKDALAALAYAAILKTHTPISYGNSNNYYKDVPAMDKTMLNTILTFAYANNLQLYPKGIIKPEETVTLKNVAAILLQLDNRIGLQSGITTNVDKAGNSVAYDLKLEKNLDSYPQNWENFACILKSVPGEAYKAPFENMPTLDGSFGKNPRMTYNFAREYSGMFVELLKQSKDSLKKNKGIDVRFTYIPSLVCFSQSGYTMRVKCEIVNTGGADLTYGDVFGNTDESAKEKIYNGMAFYADAVTDYTIGTGAGASFALGKMIYKEK